MSERKTVWFSMFRRMVPADYEQWLEELAREGWNVEKIGQFGSICMTFRKTEPKQYRYVFDLNAFPNNDYRSMYEQFGWEYAGRMSSCFVWRKEYTGERPESFTDKESLVKRNRRVLAAVAVCFAAFVLACLILLAGIGLCLWRGRTEKLWGLGAETLVLGLITVYLGWAVAKIRHNIER